MPLELDPCGPRLTTFDPNHSGNNKRGKGSPQQVGPEADEGAPSGPEQKTGFLHSLSVGECWRQNGATACYKLATIHSGIATFGYDDQRKCNIAGRGDRFVWNREKIGHPIILLWLMKSSESNSKRVNRAGIAGGSHFREEGAMTSETTNKCADCPKVKRGVAAIKTER